MTAWTEEEAKTKWCPFAPTKFKEVTTDGIASRCMAWRWMPDEIDPITGHSFAVCTGFCGLAGRPE